jgi:hypothetical protein
MFSIPDKYIIHDLRNSREFKKLTISGYKIQDVTKAYQNSMINNNLEDSIRWCVELHCTGLENNIWDSLYILITKHIHINNPKLFIYLKKRQKEYESIISKYPPKFYHIYSKNNQEIRHIFAELTSLCCLTKKNNIFLQTSLPKLGNNFFDKNNLSKRMISRDLDNIIDYCNNNTTKELKLGLNEIYSNIESNKGTFDNCLYWYLWIEKAESIRNKDIKNDNNIIYNEEDNELWVMILWKIINKHKSFVDDNDKIFIKKIFNDYTNNFKLSYINKKKYLLFMAFYVLKKKINWSIQLYQQEHLLLQVIGNINKMYEKIKVNNESHLNNDSKTILYKNFNNIFYKKYDKDEVKIKQPVKIFDNRINPEDNKILFTKYPEYEQISRKKKVEFIINNKEEKSDHNSRNNEYNLRNIDNNSRNNEYNLRNNDHNSRNNDHNSRNNEYNSRNNDHNSRNNEHNIKTNELKTINYHNKNNFRNNIINEHKFKNNDSHINNDINNDVSNDVSNDDSYNDDSYNDNSYNDDNDDNYDNDDKIGKSITNEDIINAKNEKLEKKINAFKQLISYKKNNNTNLEDIKNNNSYLEEIKNIEIIKKRRNDN